MESVLIPCRKTSTGVDWFIIDTENGAAIRIHKAVDYWAKYIVDQIRSPQTARGVSGLGNGIIGLEQICPPAAYAVVPILYLPDP